MVGIAMITAALVVLLSAFNGIEVMIEGLFSDFDADITIRLKEGKTFNEKRIDIDRIAKVKGVTYYSRAIEEVVILKHEKKWINANLIGVDSSFLKMTRMKEHVIDGDAILNQGNFQVGLIGATLLDNLDGFIPESFGNESIVCYAPKRKIRIRPGTSPFYSKVIKLSGRINYNKEINASFIIVPIELSRDLLKYTHQISAYYISINTEAELEEIKSKIQTIVGSSFSVKTNYEKNELVFQTSKSEKIIVMIILLFIFILAAFNLIASLTMLFVEKLNDIKTMSSFGMDRSFLFKIFFYEGLLISGKGILIGIILGYSICLLQINFDLVTMPNSGGEAFPIALSLNDGLLIIALVSILSVVLSFLPVKYLIHKNVEY